MKGLWRSLGLVFAASIPALPVSAEVPRLEHFFASPQLTGLKLSPDGTHAAGISPRDDDWRLVVLSLDPIEIVQEISVKRRTIYDFWWVNDERLLLSLSFKDGREARLAGADSDGGRTVDFGKVIERQRWNPTEARLLDLLPSSRENVLVRFVYQGNPALLATEVTRFNAYTGKYTVIAGRNVRALDWLTDPSGELRFGYAQLRADGYYLHRDPDDLSWQPIKSVAGMDVERLNFVPLGYPEAGAPPVVASRHDGDRFRLYGYDVEKGSFSEPLAGHPEFDVGGEVLRSRNGELRGVFHREHYWEVHWLDDAWARRARLLERSLPDARAWIVNADAAEKRFLVYVADERRPPLYLLYTEKPQSLRPITSLHPELSRDQLAATEPVSFPARDGARIPAYLTRPRGGAKGLPVVVVVHDGPWTASSWIRFWSGRVGRGFDPEVQFLASRGWAVFQPNYRGSTGYGLKHEKAGFGQWGGRILDDVADGVRWLVQQDIADPQRICIYGQGFGGYAALASLVKTPELYRCGAAYDGLYDLPAFHSATGRFVYDEEIKKRMGDDGKQLAAISPARHAEAIQVPVLVARGDEGGPGWLWTEPQFDAMVDALEDAEVDHEKVELDDDGKGLRFSEENRERFYQALELFLQRHLAPPSGS